MRGVMLLVGVVWVGLMVYGLVKPLPVGLSVAGRQVAASEAGVEFLYDLTCRRSGELVTEQRIFARLERIIAEAERFLLLDFFLFNGLRNPEQSFPPLASALTEALLRKKEGQPQVDIVLITDEINSHYGVEEPEHFQRLRQAGVRIISTDTSRLRDSNFFYSPGWRLFGQWFSSAGPGWLPNPFAASGPKMTLAAYLRLLNFKANHRKVAVSEKEALLSSANPHDASALHANIALVVRGEVLREVLAAERAVAEFSGHTLPEWQADTAGDGGPLSLQLLTEGKIKERILEGLGRCGEGCTVRMAMFYLSEREIIGALLDAAERGAEVRLILDANQEAFGRRKGGIPNRPVAQELLSRSRGKIGVRWYRSSGEQFHSKLTMLTFPKQSLLIGGSANLTRRNIGDLNLEACLAVQAPNEAGIVREVAAYFERLWENEDGLYTHDGEQLGTPPRWQYILYRFQEWSGMSTF